MAVMWGNQPTINSNWGDQIANSYFQGQQQKRQNELLDARKAYGQAINPDGSVNYAKMLGLAAGAGDTESLFNFKNAQQGDEAFGWRREDRNLDKAAVDEVNQIFGGGAGGEQPSKSVSSGPQNSYYDRLAQIESGNNPNARNPKSSAAGVYQFMPETAKQYGLEDPFDPVASRKAVERLTADNANILRRNLGREPTDGELYLAHQQGAGGALALLANPDKPAASVLGKNGLQKVVLNGGRPDMTGAQFASLWTNKFSNPAVMNDASPAAIGVAPSPNMPAQAAPIQANGPSIGLQSPPPGFPQDPSRVPTENLIKIINNPHVKSEYLKKWAFDLLQSRLPQSKEYNFIQGKGGGIYRTNPRTGEAELVVAPQPGDSGAEYGLAPVWGTDKDGNPALVQLGKDGNPIQPRLPEGFKISRDPIKVDMGTGTALLDPQTRQQIGFVPKDVRGEAAASSQGKEEGEAKGKAIANLPQIVGQANEMLGLIDGLRKDPGRSIGTGKSSIFSNIPGTAGYDFKQKVEQLKGGTFLEAFNSLRGGGQITEIEGKKAENALARLDTAQTEEGFLAALNDYESVIRKGVERAQQKAGASPTGSIQIGTIYKGYRFKGGDLNKPESWEKVQ